MAGFDQSSALNQQRNLGFEHREPASTSCGLQSLPSHDCQPLDEGLIQPRSQRGQSSFGTSLQQTADGYSCAPNQQPRYNSLPQRTGFGQSPIQNHQSDFGFGHRGPARCGQVILRQGLLFDPVFFEYPGSDPRRLWRLVFSNVQSNRERQVTAL